MKVIVTGEPTNPHLVTWLGAALGARHSYYFLPGSDQWGPYPAELEALAQCSGGQLRLPRPAKRLLSRLGVRVIDRLAPGLWHAAWLGAAARALEADLVHALQPRQLGYESLNAIPRATAVCLQAGSDQLFELQTSDRHPDRGRLLLARASFCLVEAAEEGALTRELGFRGGVIGPVLPPAPLGLGQASLRALRGVPPSQSRTIAIRDAGATGRTHMVLDALLPIRELTNRFRVVVYSASEEIRLHAHVLRRDHALAVETLPCGSPDATRLELLSGSRVAIALDIPGGSHAELVGAMAAGALPIHPPSGVARELIVDGVSGLLVDARRPDSVTRAIERGLTDDALVDSAARLNWQTYRERLDSGISGANIHAAYDEMECALRKRRSAGGIAAGGIAA